MENDTFVMRLFTSYAFDGRNKQFIHLERLEVVSRHEPTASRAASIASNNRF